MVKVATLAILGLVTAGILSLVFGFSLNSGVHTNPPPTNVVHTKIVIEGIPKAHWPSPAAHHFANHKRIHIP